MTTPIEQFRSLRLQKVKSALEANFFEASIHSNLTSAEDYLISQILPGSGNSVGFGGSATIAGSGLLGKLGKVPNLKIIDRNDSSLSPQDRQELSRQTLLVDLFIASSNAITLNGELVNVDKFGNRIAALTFGPKKVALLVGYNKICDNIEVARLRVKNEAAPANAIRLGLDTPCTKTSTCHDCHGATRICGIWNIIKRCFPAQRIHVLLIDQDLGF